jgi:hypothetical protein
MTAATVVAMESGSEWPGHLGESTVIGLASIGREDLVQRTREKHDVLRRANQPVRVAVLTCR